MSGGYALSREAGLDLAEIEDYTARHWGDAQAEHYIRELFVAFDRLAENPGLGHRRDDIPEPYRIYSVGSHLIIFREHHMAGRVEILNILHPAMDTERRMRQALEYMAQRKRR